MTRNLILLLAVLALLLVACGAAEEPKEPEDKAQTTVDEATVEFKTPLPEATEAVVLPTNTPVPPPPTPTPQPTAAPTETAVPEPTATPAEEATQAPAEQATEAPTEAPPPTSPPAPAITDIMVEIPAGPFAMGSDEGDREDKPAHEVDLPAYEIDKFEVTNADYSAFVEATGYQTDAEQQGKQSWRDAYKEGRENHPVVKVSWNDAVAFCEWVGKRLPTEAEWEKAARGTDPTNYWPWGSDWDPSRCNSYFNAPPDTFAYSAPVGLFEAGQSPYAIYDMAGNVWEWVNDWYDAGYYSVSPDSNPTGPDSGDFKVFRGGGWGNIGNYLCRTADRRYHSPVGSNGVIGIRPAR